MITNAMLVTIEISEVPPDKKQAKAHAYAINRRMTAATGVNGWRFLPAAKRSEHERALRELELLPAMRVCYLPVPTDSGWREWIAYATKAAQAEVRDNLRESIEKAAHVLADPEAVFRDSLIENIGEIAGMSLDLNVTGAKDIASAAKAAAADLATLDPTTLRENPDARQIAAKRAAAIAKMLG